MSLLFNSVYIAIAVRITDTVLSPRMTLGGADDKSNPRTSKLLSLTYVWAPYIERSAETVFA